MKELSDYETALVQLEIAISTLHVIAVMTEMECAQASDMALSALKEMETHGLLYEYFFDEDE